MFKNINRGEWILIPVKHAYWKPAMLQVDPNIMDKYILFPAQVFQFKIVINILWWNLI